MMPQYRKLTTLCYAAVLAFGLAACGGGGTETAEVLPAPDPGPDPALGLAQMAAAVAATAADTAADAAEGAVMAQDANAAADAGSYAVANNAAMRARAAATAAQGASDAAAATDDTAAAEAQQAIAEAKQGEAETEQGNAEMYAGMVAVAHQANLDEIQRVMDVDDARTAAMGSYKAADADATKAEMQAAEAETTAPGSPGAVTAGEAATAARTAANAAMAAHDAIMDDMTKAQADAQASEAATQAGLANDGYLTAMAENDDIQTTGSQIAENNRQNAVTAARKYGGAAADNAMQSATNARAAANAAKNAHDDAMAEYMRAKSARTNSPKAKEYADAAGVAYAAANSAAGGAHAAYMAAKAAVGGVMDDSSLEDANTARDTAEAQEGIAMGHMSTAMTQQTAAEGAEMKATMYADMHVVGLLRMANAYHITGPTIDPANTEADELDAIAKNKSDHVAAVNDAVRAASEDSDDPSHGGAEVTATYPHSATVPNADADEDTERTGKPLIALSAGATAALVHARTVEDGDDITDNFVLGPGLGDFPHEKYITGRDGDGGENTGTRVILFTDLEQASEPKDGTSDAVDNAAVSSASRVDITGAVVPAAGEVARNFPGMYDHDGNPATPAFTGTFTCADPLTCTVNLTDTTDQGAYQDGTEVISITNYRFSGTRTIPEMNPMEDTTWLAFGVWLTETVEENGVNAYAFGAFADGGAAVGNADNIEVVTGTATYEGSAAGVHSTATEVEFFSANATLEANFGANDANGMITGKIHDIVSGRRTR